MAEENDFLLSTEQKPNFDQPTTAEAYPLQFICTSPDGALCAGPAHAARNGTNRCQQFLRRM